MGSEMCIRDSLDPVAVHVDLTERETPRFRVDQLREPAPRQLHPCLLYTSDAADERSSVDLGGRRIIKKKTT